MIIWKNGNSPIRKSFFLTVTMAGLRQPELFIDQNSGTVGVITVKDQEEKEGEVQFRVGQILHTNY
jgi:hypothetical protein